MSTPTIASDMVIAPSPLGEHQFYGDDYAGRTIVVDIAAGTMGIKATSGNPSHVFTWCVPNVPLSALAPLLDELLPHVRAALQGASIGTDRAGKPTPKFTEGAETHLGLADGIVARFYRRWTGRFPTSSRVAVCRGCEEQIVSSMNVLDGLWVTADKSELCRDGEIHVPYPKGTPQAPVRQVPGHSRDLAENGGRWTGACGCGRWAWTEPALDWHEVAIGWYLHAEAIPPGAPFDD
jgi:hypothetical protein